MSPRTLAHLAETDLRALTDGGRAEPWLAEQQQRSAARTLGNQPLTPAERLAAFRAMGFKPHGLYLPHDRAQADATEARLRAIGALPDVDAQQVAYFALQAETAAWARAGVPGAWTGQMALAHSPARFRIAGWGRRGGKTFYALHEGLAVAQTRPRSTIWVGGPIMKHVTRLWDPLVTLVQDLGLRTVVNRNTSQEKLIQLDNGSRLEGVSLENIWSAAGASVNFAIVDEAAQLIPEAWTRGIMPVLADTMGHALLLSSFEGAEGFFYEQVCKAQAQGLAEWEAFHSETWRNFFMFPQGEDSPAILQAKRNAQDPMEFLEQYGAAPSSSHLRVYPEFKPRIHCGDYGYDPSLPVRLAVDPSKGANAYAVAVIQKDPETGNLWVCDEYYRVGAMAEDVHHALAARPWRWAVTDVVIDSADPNEILRWCQADFPAFAVPDKPEPEMRYPILRRLLRDPVRYWPLHEAKLAQVLAAQGRDADAYRRLDVEARHVIEVEVEMTLADTRLTPADIDALRACSHFFVNGACTATIDEFENFLRNRPRKNYLNQQERARKYKDHLMDAIGYYCWVFEREDYLAAMEGDSAALDLVVDSPAARVPLPRGAPSADPPPVAIDRAARHRGFLAALREAYAPPVDSSYLVTEVG